MVLASVSGQAMSIGGECCGVAEDCGAGRDNPGLVVKISLDFDGGFVVLRDTSKRR